MPAFYLNKCLRLKLLSSWREFEWNLHAGYAETIKYDLRCNELKLLTAKLQCTENVLENITQLTVLIIIILLSHTTTRAVVNIEAIFVGSNQALPNLLAALSFISIIRGQLTFLKANKAGCLSLKASLIVALYFIVGTCSR